MPRYDYMCNECSEIFEVEHGMTEKPPVQCPTCGTYLTRKIIIETPGLYIYWKDARSSSEATLPKYLSPVKRPKHRERRGGREDGYD
jgi:putative FmdB family regulatory protein